MHTRVADLFNEPHNQIEQQLRLTIEALYERGREKNDLVNNPDYGLLHNLRPQAAHLQPEFLPGAPRPRTTWTSC